MRAKPQWYETFFDGLYGRVLGGEAMEARAAADAKTIRRLLKLRKGRRVLDCPCGLGRIALQLAKMGLAVTGADLTPSYVRSARRRAKADGLDIRFIRADMRNLPFDAEFDAVVNWFSSFGYFDDAGNLAAARAAFAALKPGGRFLVDVMNKSALLPRFTPTGEADAGGIHIANRRRWDARANCIRDVWTMSRGGQIERRSIRLRIYNGAEMRALLRAAGFRDVRFFGHPPVGRFTRHSRRMIAIGTRPTGRAGRPSTV